MLTKDRSEMAARAVRAFREQTYQNKRLYILDTGNENAGYFLDDDDVSHRWADISLQTWSIGRLRNEACHNNADADIFIHWDDDDWSAPDRVERQLRLLESSGKPVVGVHDLLYHRMTDRTLWRYDFQGTPPYACGTSLCYLRSYWEAHRFPEKRHSEDTDFAMKARAEGNLASEPNAGMIVARWHGHNTYDPRFGPKPFTRERRENFPAAFLAQEGL